MQRSVQLLLLLFLPLLAARAQKNISIQLENGKAKSIIIPISVLKHYPSYPDSVSFFELKLEGESASILGSREVINTGLKFTPLWPLTPGAAYQVYWKNNLVDSILIPVSKGSHPTVKVFPSGDTLPENQLKIYFVFSKPMQEGSSNKYIRISNEKNDTLQNIFLDLKPELWNADHTMLTIWVDPGRIKRDLLLNQELGKPLQSNSNYTLVVLPGWKDTDGMELTTLFIKKFFTNLADREKPGIKTWSLITPEIKTKLPLVIRFPEAMDYALAIRGIDVYNQDKKLKGKVNLIDNEFTWTFLPDDYWAGGKYKVKINPQVEDLAGNNLERLFDNDLHAEVSALENQRGEFIIDFEIH